MSFSLFKKMSFAIAIHSILNTVRISNAISIQTCVFLLPSPTQPSNYVVSVLWSMKYSVRYVCAMCSRVCNMHKHFKYCMFMTDFTFDWIIKHENRRPSHRQKEIDKEVRHERSGCFSLLLIFRISRKMPQWNDIAFNRLLVQCKQY